MRSSELVVLLLWLHQGSALGLQRVSLQRVSPDKPGSISDDESFICLQPICKGKASDKLSYVAKEIDRLLSKRKPTKQSLDRQLSYKRQMVVMREFKSHLRLPHCSYPKQNEIDSWQGPLPVGLRSCRCSKNKLVLQVWLPVVSSHWPEEASRTSED